MGNRCCSESLKITPVTNISDWEYYSIFYNIQFGEKKCPTCSTITKVHRYGGPLWTTYAWTFNNHLCCSHEKFDIIENSQKIQRNPRSISNSTGIITLSSLWDVFFEDHRPKIIAMASCKMCSHNKLTVACFGNTIDNDEVAPCTKWEIQ